MSSLHRFVKEVAGVGHEVLIQGAVKGDVDGHALLLSAASSACLLPERCNGSCNIYSIIFMKHSQQKTMICSVSCCEAMRMHNIAFAYYGGLDDCSCQLSMLLVMLKQGSKCTALWEKVPSSKQTEAGHL